MGPLHGMTIQLEVLEPTGTDSFNVPTYSSVWTDVADVIVGQPTDQEQVDAMNLYGRKAVYILGIPKGDTHDWTSGRHVRFWGEEFRIFGHSVRGTDDLVPLRWNQKVMVEGNGTYTD